MMITTVYDVNETCRKVFEIAQSKGMSDSGLAKALDVTPQAINKWRKGVCGPSMDKLVELVGVFQVTPNDLISYHEVTLNYEDYEH